MSSPDGSNQRDDLKERAWVPSPPQEVSLYFHVPFCRRKCPYCHFYSLPATPLLLEAYTKALLLEIERMSPYFSDQQIPSLYFGGGTPSLLDGGALSALLTSVLAHVPGETPEITLECNPEEVSLPLLRDLFSLGINRLSFGVQSFDDSMLHLLGRHHTRKTALEAIEHSCTAGFSNISIDLMYDLPKQELSSWEETVRLATSLPIQHISLYNLTLEPQTKFYRQREQLRPLLPSEEESCRFYTRAEELFTQSGFAHYELSAFARNGHFSRHNTGYWLGRSFLGLGPSAFSYWKGKRFRNIAHFRRWQEAIVEKRSSMDFSEELSPKGQTRELLAVALRLLSGLDLPSWKRRCPEWPLELEKELTDLEEKGLLKREGDCLRLTQRGSLLYDEIATLLVEA